MEDLYKCPECYGNGSYEILNAYDSTYREKVPCGLCSGVGFVPLLLSKPPVLVPSPVTGLDKKV